MYGKHAADLARAIDGWWKAEKVIEKRSGDRTERDGEEEDKMIGMTWELSACDDAVGRVALAVTKTMEGQKAWRLLEGVKITEEMGRGQAQEQRDGAPWGWKMRATDDEESEPETGEIRIEWRDLPHVWNDDMVCRLDKKRDPRTVKVGRWWQEKRLLVEAVVDGEGRLAFMGAPDEREGVKCERRERKTVKVEWSREDVVQGYRNAEHAHYDEVGKGRQAKRLVHSILATGPRVVSGYLRLLVVATGLELLWGMVTTGMESETARKVLRRAGRLQGVDGYQVALPRRGRVGMGEPWGGGERIPVRLVLRGTKPR